jgi:hypothetical protein
MRRARIHGVRLFDFRCDPYRRPGAVTRPETSLEYDDRSIATAFPAWTTRIAAALYAVNVTAIVAGIMSGHRKGDVALRFQEKQSITYFSSNQLAMTALLSAAIFLLGRHVLGARDRSTIFWLLSSLAYFYLMLDESFQFHEGMDSRVVDLVAPGAKNPRLDGLSTAFYGLGALVVSWMFRIEILRFRQTLLFFCVGGFFLAATSALNFGDAAAWRVVAEESCKLLGVCSFFLGYLAAFLGTVSEVRERAGARVPASTDRRQPPSSGHHAS